MPSLVHSTPSMVCSKFRRSQAPCLSAQSATPALAEHILCERCPPYQICLRVGCSYFDPHLLADLLSAVLRDHLQEGQELDQRLPSLQSPLDGGPCPKGLQSSCQAP